MKISVNITLPMRSFASFTGQTEWYLPDDFSPKAQTV